MATSDITKYYDDTKVPIYELTAADLDSGSTGYRIGFGLFNSNAYLKVNISWVCLEVRCNGNNQIAVRMKFGNSLWSDWSIIN